MKSLLKATLLTAAIAAAISAPLVYAAPAAKAEDTVKVSNSHKAEFKDDNQQVAYALGASFGRYMDNSLKEQSKLGIQLNKKDLLNGLRDAFDNKSKLSDEEISETLRQFEGRVKDAAQQHMEKISAENAQKGAEYRKNFAKEAGVKTSETGLLYKIEKPGSGPSPTDNDTVVVNYSGKLVDGTEFDSSYKRKEPLSFRLDSVIPGWTEGLKYLKKGGKIEMVIPPKLAYGSNGVPGIPPNSTLVFQVELLDIKPTAEAEKPAASEKPAAENDNAATSEKAAAAKDDAAAAGNKPAAGSDDKK